MFPNPSDRLATGMSRAFHNSPTNEAFPPIPPHECGLSPEIEALVAALAAVQEERDHALRAATSEGVE
jgi:hypothetical protein